MLNLPSLRKSLVNQLKKKKHSELRNTSYFLMEHIRNVPHHIPHVHVHVELFKVDDEQNERFPSGGVFVFGTGRFRNS